MAYPKTSELPGLKWRKRADGREIPVWCARADAIKAGFPVKTMNLSDVPDELLPARCQRLWAEMLAFMSAGAEVITEVRYDGTLRSLLDLYERHEDSPFHKLKKSSLKPYAVYMRKIREAHGSERIAKITGLDLSRWHKAWRAPVERDGKARIGAAAMALSVLKAALSFGKVAGIREAGDLLSVARELSLPSPAPRNEAPEAQDVERARAAAHALGRHSAALCYALQFETTARQWDLIGQWVPMDDPRPSTIFSRGEKWIGLTWADIASGIMSITPTKTEKSTRARVSIDLSLCPMVQEEIARVPVEARRGPLIVNERTGKPYAKNAFADLWRKVRDEAELSPTLWNRDMRAGGITEGGIAGASADDRAKLAGHNSTRMTQKVYDRDVLVSANRVAEARAKFRKGEG